jgi:cholesterol transport system auxiliary component
MRETLRNQLVGLICTLGAMTSGCQSGPAVRETFYRLSPEFTESVPKFKACGTVMVRRPGTRGFAGGRAIAFRERASSPEIHRYNYHSWSESPALMIQDAMVRALRTAGLARYVITPAERANADWIVSGNLLRMEHFPNAVPARILIEAEIGIAAANTRQTLFWQRYQETEPAPTNGIEDAVLAFKKALERMLGQFQTDAGKVLAQDRSSCD